MSVDLKDLETTPTLSLDPFGEAEKEPASSGSSRSGGSQTGF